MQLKSILLRMAFVAVVTAASGAAVAPVSAAAAGAGPLASSPSVSAGPADGPGLSAEQRRTIKPGPVKLVLPGKFGTTATTQTVCYVYL